MTKIATALMTMSHHGSSPKMPSPCSAGITSVGTPIIMRHHRSPNHHG